MEFSCCKKSYSIRYKLLHRTVTNQSTKHLLIRVRLVGSDGREHRGGTDEGVERRHGEVFLMSQIQLFTKGQVIAMCHLRR